MNVKNYPALLAVIMSLMVLATACTNSMSNPKVPGNNSTQAVETLDATAQTSEAMTQTSEAAVQTLEEIAQTSEATTLTSDATTQAEPAAPSYFFINGALMGSFANNQWYSLGNIDEKNNKADFYAKDLLDQEGYSIYHNREFAGVSKQIVWTTEEIGLGSFEREGVSEKLKKYGQAYTDAYNNSTWRKFDLPAELGDELSDLKIPDYAFITQFITDKQREAGGFELATNSNAQLFSRDIAVGAEATEQGKQALIDLFKAKMMENTEANFTKCVQGDFDNDGEDEYLMFAGNPRSENGYPILVSNGKQEHLGVFSAILYQDKDDVQTLYSDLRPYDGNFEANQGTDMELVSAEHCIASNLVAVADLNSDGIYEIGAVQSQWERGCYLVYAMNSEGRYEAVMRSDWGL